jgi:hypothetical protein
MGGFGNTETRDLAVKGGDRKREEKKTKDVRGRAN